MADEVRSWRHRMQALPESERLVAGLLTYLDANPAVERALWTAALHFDGGPDGRTRSLPAFLHSELMELVLCSASENISPEHARAAWIPVRDLLDEHPALATAVYRALIAAADAHIFQVHHGFVRHHVGA